MSNNQNTQTLHAGIAIFAGNSRVHLNERDGSIVVEPQLAAFRAALTRAAEISKNTKYLPPISVAFDHRGIFRKQFLIEGLTNSQKRHPRLSQLKMEIVEIFREAAADSGIPLEAISVIHEDSARTHASHLVQNGNLPEMLIGIMKKASSEEDDDEEPIGEACSMDAQHVDRVTCTAVTSEYFFRSLTKESRLLEVFIEDDPWSQVGLYVRGAVLMEALGSVVKVSLRLVSKQGHVSYGQSAAS